MSDLEKRIKERGDWLVDAVAMATQNRQFLRGEPECDDVACEAIRMNGEKAMDAVAKPLSDRIAELEAERDEALNKLDSVRHSVEVLEGRVKGITDNYINLCERIAGEKDAAWNAALEAAAKAQEAALRKGVSPEKHSDHIRALMKKEGE